MNIKEIKISLPKIESSHPNIKFHTPPKKIEIKHINNKANSETSALLLKHDSIHGKFNADIKFNKNNFFDTYIN